MAVINAGNVVGLITSEIAPLKTNVIWAKIINPSEPNKVVLHYFDAAVSDWRFLQEDDLLTPVIDDALNDPPVSPNDGDAYIIGSVPTGVWAGRTLQHAEFFADQWNFIVPTDGIVVVLKDVTNTMFTFNGVYGAGGIWQQLQGAPLSDAEVKTAYENNADTNAFTDVEKTKVASEFGLEYHYGENLPSQSNSTDTELEVFNKVINITAGNTELTASFGVTASNTSKTIVVRFFIQAVLIGELRKILNDIDETVTFSNFANVVFTAGAKTVTVTLATEGGGAAQTSFISNIRFRSYKTNTPL